MGKQLKLKAYKLYKEHYIEKDIVNKINSFLYIDIQNCKLEWKLLQQKIERDFLNECSAHLDNQINIGEIIRSSMRYVFNSIIKMFLDTYYDARMPTEDMTIKSIRLEGIEEQVALELDGKYDMRDLQDLYIRLFKDNITVDDINTIMRYRRKESSANSVVHSEYGHITTLGDILNTGKQSFEEYRKERKEEELLWDAINILEPYEKEIFCQWHGIGYYTKKKAPTYAALAFNNNINGGHEAKEIIEDIEIKLANYLLKRCDES